MLKKSLISLAFGSFAIGMTEFSMMGVLPDVAADLSIDIPTAGYFIALYAFGVVVGAPTLVMALAAYPPKKALLFLMGLFVLFNGLFALVPGYHTLLIARFMSGLPHGAFFGVGSVVAASLASRGKEAQAISIMFTGMTIANLLGVPLGTYIGHHYSWRYTYVFVTLCGVATLAALYVWLPAIKSHLQGGVSQQFHYFKTKTAWLMMAMISIGTGGLFAWISYIAPLMTEVAKVQEDQVSFVMVVVGLGMVVGNLIGGKLADTVTPNKAVILSFASMAVCLLVVYFTAHINAFAYPMAFITGMISFSNGSPLQMMLINSAKHAETLAAAGGQASFNLGNTLGAYLGGLPIVWGLGYHSPLLVGVLMATVGALFALYILVMRKYGRL
ncbi:MFS transporter [Parapedobacter sp. ISTM3]|uniref:MFS transporter n=1 Tax=Parapedobacter sp. ISTM3 TaxID=2800130 RepID=UPI001906520A|nr:MFS transporter [Parapedobacter sp. ISTM3]